MLVYLLYCVPVSDTYVRTYVVSKKNTRYIHTYMQHQSGTRCCEMALSPSFPLFFSPSRQGGRDTTRLTERTPAARNEKPPSAYRLPPTIPGRRRPQGSAKERCNCPKFRRPTDQTPHERWRQFFPFFVYFTARQNKLHPFLFCPPLRHKITPTTPPIQHPARRLLFHAQQTTTLFLHQ